MSLYHAIWLLCFTISGRFLEINLKTTFKNVYKRFTIHPFTTKKYVNETLSTKFDSRR